MLKITNATAKEIYMKIKRILASKNKIPVKKVLKSMFSEAIHNRPIIFFAYIIQFIVIILQKFQFIILPKLLIDALVAVYNGNDSSDQLKKIIFYIILTIGIILFSGIFNNIVNRIKGLCQEWFNEYFQVKINHQVMSVDFECTEDPAVLDQMSKAKEGMDWYSENVCGILDRFFDIISNIIVLIGVIVIIFVSSPLVIIFQIVSITFFAIFNKKIRQIEIESFQKLAKSNRVFSYLFFELSDFSYGKDIRLYNASKLFTHLSSEHLDKQNEISAKRAIESKKQYYKMNFVNFITTIFIYLYIGIRALKNIITIGDFSMCISASNDFTNCCQNIVRNIQEILQRSNYVNEYLKFMEYPVTLQKGTKKVDLKKPHQIEFKNVSFKYPRSEKFVLKNINLKISYGQHLAIVGLNGAGKTTFIKLLCRLYDVTEGEILIDGVNIKEYSDEEYRKLFAVLFQDFKLLAFSLKENIAFNDNADDSKIDEVLKLAGLYDDVQKLPKKEQTSIYKSFDESGIELSGGQKQKTAIARALYKDSPIVILDEPTAALDPLAEAEIYEDFNKMVGGKTAIYISHRLSSCKFCHQIAVFSEGKIAEFGTHEQLMKIECGIYNKMFTTQAKPYLEKVAE